jgi:hypothetical protein
MNDLLQQQCQTAFADHVNKLFAETRAREHGSSILSVPIIDFSYYARNPELVPELKRIVVAALTWRERFARSKPDWAPVLPVTIDGILRMQASASRRMKKLGDFAYSLLLARWDVRHPDYEDYVRAGEDVWNHDETMEGWEQLFQQIHFEPGGVRIFAGHGF